MIREKDGIHIERDRLYVADSRNSKGDVNIVSHAHFDHLHMDENKVVCSEQTAQLAEARTGNKVSFTEKTENIELIPSGHIIGSSAALIEDGEKILYTGDFSAEDRAYMKGFQPPEADTLIIESTYGIPAYRFPSHSEVKSRIADWIESNSQPLFLYGYSLGKAQKIQSIVQEVTERPIVAHGAVEKMNEAVEKVSDQKFRAKSYTDNKDLLEENGIFIGPTRSARKDSMNSFVEKVGGVKAGFSGWASTDSYMYRGGYDETFVLSDHADFDGLVETVKRVDPEKVYTTHGFDEALAGYLSRELGFNAKALKKNQTSLTDF
ncbi:MBL fold metallo-hydrolase RNA specificity domain-containing protein [Candidatus Nanohalococcus occultus]|uniref:MBL fold metallo-hydrolase RNA specificity domain-containing protein n=1 Tax=Candidatus Nanohalococcus occultus TaxID=2978047 RepID=UPI0039E124F8